ncbi:hypothetical protein EC968_001160 [Mortierella alpina]|nr:hypothetical protein EC968_001160 [Mortierella alpina]
MSNPHDQQEQQEPSQPQADERSSLSERKRDSAVPEEQGVGEPSASNMQETPSPLQLERTAQTSPTPASPAARVRPASVTIDLSETLPKPPAYDHDDGASPASRQESGHHSSIHFQPHNANRHLPLSSGAPLPLSQSGYRRPFLEEDELPEYMTLSAAGPPFKIPANRSTTYTVTPSQGPIEFQPQPHLQPSGSVPPPLSNSRPPRTRPQTTSSTHTAPGAIGQQGGSRRQHGAWTLEYWVDDTITYLCYLMDPKLSATTALVPRNLADNVGSSQNRVSSLTEVTQSAAQTLPSSPSNVSRTVSTPPPQEQQQQQQNQHQQQQERARPLSQQSSNISPDPPGSGQFEAVGSSVGRVNGTIRGTTEQGDSLSNEPSKQSGLERVPTGHIRGRPPPLSRARNAATLTPYMSAEQAADDIDIMMVGMGSHRGIGPVLIRAPRTEPAAGSPTSEPAPEPVVTATATATTTTTTATTIQVDTPDPIPALSDETRSMSAEVQPVESADDTVATPADERVSTDRAFGTLPPVQHVRINDGYPGEEADTMLAHAMDLQAATTTTEGGDRALPSVHSNAFNNALTSEFFKNPTFAFVSAEDPQTWIWWSSHHESNLQRCRQEGPHEEVMMWWRTRIDFSSKESKARRRREKLRRTQQGTPLDAPELGFRERWQRYLSLQSSTPHQESMEITMRVRGLYYSWREETPESGYVSQTTADGPAEPGSSQGGHSVRSNGEIPLSEFSPLRTWVNSDKMRLFTLIRDDSLINGQRVKGGPVAEIWIHEGGAVEAQDPMRSPLAAIPTYQSVFMAPPPPPPPPPPLVGEVSEAAAVGELGAGIAATTGGAGSGAMMTEGNEPASFIRSGSSSVISNNGTTANTFMTDVSAFTGGPVRSTIASTYHNHPGAGDRPSSSSPSSAPSLVGRESVSSGSTGPAAAAGAERYNDDDDDDDDDSRFTSSFPSKLRRRQCVIRVMQGLNADVETFALSTGPRLPELFDLYTDQSLPGPSRRAFVCALTTFGILVVIAFTAIAFVSR